MKSLEAAPLVADHSQHLVFVDAQHDYDNIMADSEAWEPKVVPGGILAWHDADWGEVKRAMVDWMRKTERLVRRIRGRICYATL
jgi:predicted O-methyltransferase YrrM